MLASTLFIITYIGIALGKVPGVALDRVGIALLGAIAMVSFGVLTPENAFRAIDLSTILLLYSLMIISAQLRLGGFYSWSALKILTLLVRPKLFLLALMLLSALLSALLANDIVCFAFTPVLATALLQAQLNPLPFLLGLAAASNIGSAATIIGNPQNMLIGQVGQLDFGAFLLWCGPPSVAALVAAYGIILLLFRNKLSMKYDGPAKSQNSAHPPLRFEQLARSAGFSLATKCETDKYPGPQLQRGQDWPAFDRWQTTKGLIAVGALIVLFLTPLPREVSAISIAGVLLCSRRQKTRDILGLVDWHLITLFCALFIMIQGILDTPMVPDLVGRLSQLGLDLHNLPLLTVISTVLSNLFSNVPATMLLFPFLSPDRPDAWYTLALSSTFAGNLLLLGSIANLIVAEQARHFGIRVTLREHALVGIPVTAASLLVLLCWISI